MLLLLQLQQLLLLMMMMARRRTMRGCQFRPGHKNGQTIRAGGTCCCCKLPLAVAPCCCPLLLPVAAAAASQCNGTISTRECAFILKCCVCNGLSRGLGLQLIQKSKQARHHRRGSNAEIREATATVRQQQQQQACCMQQAARQAAGSRQLAVRQLVTSQSHF